MPDYKRLDLVVAELVTRDATLQPLLAAVVEHEGRQYLRASALAEYLGYRGLDSFVACIARAKFTASNSNKNLAEHFVETTVFHGQTDILLSPWAVNASLMEADTRKKRVALAKNYFATLASDTARADEARLRERQAVRKNHRRLHGIAEEIAGVSTPEQHQNLDAAGYRGMYGMNVRDVERLKGVPAGEQLLDCVDHTELAANSLRLAIAGDKIVNKQITTAAGANRAHEQAGQTVRDAVVKELGVSPINLPLAPQTIDQISKVKGRELRSISKLPG